MLGYIGKRLLATIPVLLGVITVTFLLIYVVPGDPVLNMVGERTTDEVIKGLTEEYGFDKPLWVQYGRYLNRILHLRLGRSLLTRQEVLKEILERFPNTLLLATTSMILSIIFGLSIGILASIKKGTVFDYISSLFAVFGISAPVFWLGIILIFIFSICLKLLPAVGMGGGNPLYLILPSLTLATRSIAFISRITRSSMLEVLGEDYIRTARAKGLPEWIVIFKHALKNALIPVITLVGLDFGSYLNGSVLTETVFGWPGIGRYFVTAVFKRDINVIMGTVLFGAVIIIFINLVVDIMYKVIDPRIRLLRNEL
ncbi:MAG: ABC transporter permease [bacterium]|nr:ABC transporter permease [bacterium]